MMRGISIVIGKGESMVIGKFPYEQNLRLLKIKYTTKMYMCKRYF